MASKKESKRTTVDDAEDEDLYVTDEEEDLYNSCDENRDDEEDVDDDDDDDDDEETEDHRREKKKKQPNSENHRESDTRSEKKKENNSELRSNDRKRKAKDMTQKGEEPTSSGRQGGPCVECGKKEGRWWRAHPDQEDRDPRDRDTMCNACAMRAKKSKERREGKGSEKKSEKKLGVQERIGPCQECNSKRPNKNEENIDQSWKIDPNDDSGTRVICQICYKKSLKNSQTKKHRKDYGGKSDKNAKKSSQHKVSDPQPLFFIFYFLCITNVYCVFSYDLIHRSVFVGSFLWGIFSFQILIFKIGVSFKERKDHTFPIL